LVNLPHREAIIDSVAVIASLAIGRDTYLRLSIADAVRAVTASHK
jgi:hypothetical protein